MVSKACVFICVCITLFVAIQTLLPKALAYKRTSGVDEFMVEDKRTHTRQNYVVQRALDNEMNDVDYGGPRYTLDTVPARAEPEELPEFIVDYANMIRNDIILLDNSVETRTRKRGNIKVKEQGQEIRDVPCSCEYRTDPVDLSVGRGTVFPQFVYNVTCDQSLCKSPHHRCEKTIYNITIIRRHRFSNNIIQTYNSLPSELRHKWINETIPIITGCLCTSNYLISD